ncbi:MAG: hypothetical protein J6J67_00385 [Treponema sp.]|nr:hypothetical protein [Treponema sp.]
MTILLVEDDEQSIETCNEVASMSDKSIIIKVAKDFEEAKLLLNDEIDTAIVDIKLNNSPDEGNFVAEEINNLAFRIPVVIHTGTPDSVQAKVLKTFIRGEHSYEEIFNYLFDVYNTGLISILGRKGILERQLNSVYQNNILPTLENSWIKYGKDNQTLTEKALLRYVLNHLLQYLENSDDVEKCYPEEMYIYPPVDENYRTGSVLKNADNAYFIILSPACDLALHDGSFKTDRVLLAEIKEISAIITMATKHCSSPEERKKKLESIYRNTFSLYYHWLPKVDFFSGGIINFRRINSFSKKDLQTNYGKPLIQIAPFFCKDIVARFSSYYARQGQPDIDYKSFIKDNSSKIGEIK